MRFLNFYLFFVCLVFSVNVFSGGKDSAPVVDDSVEEKVLSDEEIMKKLLLKIETIELNINIKLKDLYTLQGEERAILGVQILDADKEIENVIDSAVTLLLDMKQDGGDVAEYTRLIHKHLNRRVKQLRKIHRFMLNRMGDLMSQSSTVELKKRFKHEQTINRGRVIVSNVLLNLQKNIELKKSLGINAEHDINVFSDLLLEHSSEAASRLKLLSERVDNKKSEISNSGKGEKKDLNLQLNALLESRRGVTDALSLLVKLMQKNQLDTSKISQLLITSSGTINQQIFDRKVIFGLLSQWQKQFQKWFSLNASGFVVTTLIVILILLLFKVISSMAGRLLARAFESSHVQLSKLLKEFFVVSVRRFVMFIGVLMSLSQIGVELGPLLAGLGVLGFVVGFALQGVLSNFASGLMILIYRPYDIGDVVEIAKVKGTVKEMSMVSTTMLSFNNERLVIPNNSIWGSLIRNITSESTRRVDLVFKVSFDADLELLDKIFHEEVAANSAVLENPAPVIALNKQHETHLEFIVRPWVKTADYWSTYWALYKSIQIRMNKEGVPKLNPYEFLRPLIHQS